MSAAQALAFSAADTLLVDQGSANTTTIQFGATTIVMTVAGTSVVFGAGLGNATATFADGSRLFIGTTGNDAPSAFGAEDNGLYGGAGADTLDAGDGANQLQGNQGEDKLIGGRGRDVIYGGQDNDTIIVGESSGGGTNFAQGNRGDDTISGSRVDSDTLLGGQGNDVLGASDAGPGRRSGLFTLYENPVGVSGGGNDVINGNLGDDVIFGGTGDDTLIGEDGRDHIVDSGGRNFIDAGADKDFIDVAGEATVYAGSGGDVIDLRDGTFWVDMGDGDDACIGLFEGGVGQATIVGGSGRDLIRGTNGADSISGGSENDVLAGWGGQDTLSGGDGADEFDFYGGQSFTELSDLDVILDWTSADYLYFQDLKTGDAVGPGVGFNYFEGFASTYEAALAMANAQIAAGEINYVAIQVGSDVFVFADSLTNNGVADTAVRLANCTLDAMGFANFLTG
ncbi:hypothetical protein DJ019_00155 [Phenylobacterium kunshanense]|uniref:Calcium-binding protein n=2 Tax=Phenylobacterium kunshanense TaxID=1445034 RepID=A0A328BPS8_9CAUL|nr:hypothetical protein DJ019_00155 [Phenylobacterium kunshanense]